MGKSAFRAVKGEDALLEYQSGTSYQSNKYIERNLNIFKSKTSTSTTFVPSEWDIVSSGVTAVTTTNGISGQTNGQIIELSLAPVSGISTGTYQSATITVDEFGRVIAASGNTSGLPSPPDGSIQFNNNNSLSGTSFLSFNKTSFGLEHGNNSTAVGQYSNATGSYAYALGNYSHASGKGISTKNIISGGYASFNHSFNNIGQVDGYGANAPYSVILGGINNHIASGVTGATIMGGNNIVINDSGFTHHTVVDNLVIWNIDENVDTINSVVVWDSADRTLKSRDLVNEPNNAILASDGGGEFASNANVLLDPSVGAITLGSRTGVTGAYSLSIGGLNDVNGFCSVAIGELNTINNCNSLTVGLNNIISGACGSVSFGYNNTVSGNYSFAIGCNNQATGNYSFVGGRNSCSTASNSFSLGVISESTRNGSFAIGKCTSACGLYSFVGGVSDYFGATVTACGRPSFNFSWISDSGFTSGYGANGNGSVILGGRNHNICSPAAFSAIIGGENINLTGGTYSGYTAVGSLAIWDQPLSGASGDEVLVWDSADKRVKRRSQSDVADAGPSDMDLKDNLKITQNSLSNVNKLAGYEFEWNHNYPEYNKIGMKDYGLVAQEVEGLYPEMVTHDFRGNDGSSYKAIKYNRLIPILVNAINELTDRVKYLENKLK